MRRLTVSTLAFAVALFTPGVAVGETGVAIEGSKFVPRDVTVRVGETVVWTNMDNLPHSVTADDGSFDSHSSCGMVAGRCMNKGETYRQTFRRAGSFPYYCRTHGARGGQGMAGAVTVTG